MSKIRINQLAKEINRENKEIIQVLDDAGFKGLKHSNNIDDDQIALVKSKLLGKEPKKAEAKTEAKVEAKTEVKAEVKAEQKKSEAKPETKRTENKKEEGEQPKKKIFTSDNNRNNRYTNNRNGDNRRFNNDRNNRNGDNRRFNNDRNDRNGDNRRFNNDRNDRNGDNRRFNNDRNDRNGDNRRFNNDRNDRNGDNRRFNNNRNDGFKKDRDTSVTETVMADKAKRDREDKLRYDREERNRDNRFNDGNGRNNKNDRKHNKHNKNKFVEQVKPAKPVKKEEPEEKIKVITIPEVLTIRELAEKMKLKSADLVKKLFLAGQIVTINSEVDYETAETIALDYDIICEKEEKVDVIAELLKEEEEDVTLMENRPPVVCVMGHVDHGKTSLLDAIRNTHVTNAESGGITQHIGAYTVDVKGQSITFLDTPGHEAFTAMRMRGAQATDIAILVVAADDGVMPQTVEAINHAKAAEVEIIVAVNKIDKPAANIERVKQELSEQGLIPEDWGGNTVFVPVSAHTGQGIDELLEMIILQAEILELKANKNRKARGLVIEAKLDKGKGSVATVLVQKGTLHVGDPISAGSFYGRVRAMSDDKGRKLKAAGPSTPVEVLGLNGVPNAGEIVIAADSEKDARSFAETFISEGREKMLEGTKVRMSLDDLYSQIQAGDLKELEIIVKADVQGSVEAVKQSLEKLSNDEVLVKVIHGGVGAINESDVVLASASNAIIIGFNVHPDNQAKELADKEEVDLRLYSVIYQAIDDVEHAMKGLLDPVFEEKVIGHAEVRQLFKASGIGTIAGSYVLDGTIQRGCTVRITREGEQIFEGPLASLKRFKDDVKEVRTGFECGLVFENFNDIQELDQVEAYIMVEVPRQ